MFSCVLHMLPPNGQLPLFIYWIQSMCGGSSIDRLRVCVMQLSGHNWKCLGCCTATNMNIYIENLRAHSRRIHFFLNNNNECVIDSLGICTYAVNLGINGSRLAEKNYTDLIKWIKLNENFKIVLSQSWLNVLSGKLLYIKILIPILVLRWLISKYLELKPKIIFRLLLMFGFSLYHFLMLLYELARAYLNLLWV